MPPKAKIPAPIDRPLSRAYLREFSGWSTAFPPGLSEPTSLRTMENMQVNRDGSLRVRPGMRYLSYEEAPTDGELLSDQVQAFTAGRNTISLPPGVQAGDQIIIFVQSPVDVSAHTLNGYTMQGQSGIVTGPDGPHPYRMQVLSLIAADSSPGVPVLGVDPVVGGGNPDAPWIACVIRGSTVVSTTVAHQESTLSAETPAATPGMQSVRVWGACADDNFGTSLPNLVTTPEAGRVVAVNDNDDSMLNIIAVADTDDGPVSASNTREVGWMMATLNFDGELASTGRGVAFDRPFVGTHEPFYLADGTKAYLLAVREEDETVGFRVLVVDVNDSTMYGLTHPDVDFAVPQGEDVLNFSADTTYVKYLQIDNKIFALSDNGEPMRVFKVGAHKEAKALSSISRPSWDTPDKLAVVHPDAAWIDRQPIAERRNRLHNPSFETNGKDWTPDENTVKSRPQSPPVTPISGSRVLRLSSKAERTNLMMQPLHDVATTGVTGWGEGQGDPTVAVDGTSMKVTMAAEKGLYFAHSRLCKGVDGRKRYQVAFDFDKGAHVDMKCRVKFFGVNGAQVGKTVTHSVTGSGRFSSVGMEAPKGAVSVRVAIGGENTQNDATWVKASKVVFCPADEPTGMFSGDSGADYFWTGDANASASVYHPPQTIVLTSDLAVSKAKQALVGSMYVAADTTARNATLRLRMLNKDGQDLQVESVSAMETVGTLARMEVGVAATPAKATRAQLRIVIPDVARHEHHYVDAAMIETGASVAGTYFDGSTTDTPLFKHSWRYGKHESVSVQKEYATAADIPVAEERTADTLRATGGKAANPYSFGFFYTFNNEVGESAASKVTVKRAARAWSDWVWETPNALGEPSGTSTDDPEKAADQLVAWFSEDVFDQAMAEGATSWSLYMFTWSDQEPVPVVGLKVAERELKPDDIYEEVAWLRVTPQQADITEDAPIPTEGNRYNYSTPASAGQGLVAADRMILVNDPEAAAVIRWSSNQIGEYTNFTARRGGGYKTLTSGNLYIPAAVKLWQNPSSVDTLTILCLGTDGHSTAFYMAPGQITSQTDMTQIMAFEETTATYGTTSPYGVEVLNNAMYHPLDDLLMKSTASNYNISHKSMTDLIENMWQDLADKYWIVSSQHDNRLYYLVHNPAGDPLEADCKGNEIWVFDAAKDTGTWSRFKIQAHSLRKIEFGNKIYMSVIRHDGVYYLDPEYSRDDYVGEGLIVGSRAIDWKFETNTQGANRAHDAWAHLQQITLVLGNFQGSAKFGVRSYDVNGRPIDRHKITQDYQPPTDDGLPWDFTDHLQVQRDLMEWSLYGESLPGVESAGQVNLVQYRYTPVSVNVGYEYGSVESFEYARNVATGNNAISTNGVPVPAIDTRRP